jgi:hypothetical protein
MTVAISSMELHLVRLHLQLFRIGVKVVVGSLRQLCANSAYPAPIKLSRDVLPYIIALAYILLHALAGGRPRDVAVYLGT